MDKIRTPYYIFDSLGFKRNFEALISEMRKYYPDYIPAYSYKTNYTPYICRLAKEIGAYAEIVSDMELYVARKIGYEDRHIVYNGPVKGPMLESHILGGGIVNIDNVSESERIVALAKQNSTKRIKVGLRINTDIGAGFISRFGLDVDGQEIRTVLDRLGHQPNIDIVGLHMHVSRARSLDAWQKRIDNILIAADSLIQGVPEYIDLGSGMFADMEPFLSEQFKIKIPTYSEYAAVVAGTMSDHYKYSNVKPKLITEPGTTVIARYLGLVTSVIGTKQIKDYRMAIVDSDYHQIGETGRMMKCPYIVYSGKKAGESITPPLNIVGFTCLEQDVLFKDFPSRLSVGDKIQFNNIGGYSIVYKPPFIQPQCPIYAIGADNQLIQIKRGETFEDIFQTFVF